MVRLDLDDEDLRVDCTLAKEDIAISIDRAYPGIDKRIRRTGTDVATSKLQPRSASEQRLHGRRSPDTDSTQGQTTDKHDSGVDIRVLYISARGTRESMVLPISAPELTKWFFGPAANMTARLVAVFEYAHEHWNDIGADWLRLFTEPKADAEIRDALHGATTTNQQQSKRLSRDGRVWTRSSARILLLAVDDARTSRRRLQRPTLLPSVPERAEVCERQDQQHAWRHHLRGTRQCTRADPRLDTFGRAGPVSTSTQDPPA
jgi:hypothetical protein